jgi:hypothetical protein
MHQPMLREQRKPRSTNGEAADTCPFIDHSDNFDVGRLQTSGQRKVVNGGGGQSTNGAVGVK